MAVGEYLDVGGAQQQADRLAAALHISPTKVLISFYGFPALPAPPAGDHDGTGRLPAGISRDWAGHPVFWLGPDVRQKRPGELSQVYVIRLWLETLVRGYWDDPDAPGGWIDVLKLEGWVPGNAEYDSRVAAYANGYPHDAFLNALQLAPGQTPDLAPNWIEDQAELLYCQHEQAYLMQMALKDDQAVIGLRAAQEWIAEIDADTALLPLQSSLDYTSMGSWEGQQALRQAVASLQQLLDTWADFVLIMQWFTPDAAATLEQERLVSEATKAQRDSQMQRGMAAVLAGSDAAAGSHLIAICRQHAHDLVRLGRMAAQGVDPRPAQARAAENLAAIHRLEGRAQELAGALGVSLDG